MSDPASSARRPVLDWRLVIGAALLLSAAAPGAAEDRGPRLELLYGPNETTQVTLASLKAELDGRSLALELPSPTSPPSRPFYTGPLPPGPHRLAVRVTMIGDSAVFPYVKDYRFEMRGSLEFASAEEGVVQATVKVTDRVAFDVEWHDRYALAFSAVRTVPLPAETSAPEAPAALVLPTAPNDRAVPSATAATCTLTPLHFTYTQASLSPQARSALDRFAACLIGNGSVVTLVGHCDRRGSRAGNQRLGLERADAAAGYLESKGVPGGRIRVESRGADAPLCAEPTTACHARNRRVVAVGSPP